MATAITTSTASLASVILEVADPEAAHRFYTAFGVDTRIRLRASEAHSAAFHGFTLALTVSRPATVDGFVGAAVDAGAAMLKPDRSALRHGPQALHHGHHRAGANPPPTVAEPPAFCASTR